MQPLFGFAQIVGGAPGHHFFAVIEKAFQCFFEIEQLGLAVDDGQHIHAKRVLQLGMLVQLIDDDLGHGIALEFDDDAHALTVRFVAQVADAFDLFLVDQRGDLLDQPFLVDLVGYFADDNLLFARALDRLSEGFAAHLHDALAFMISLNNRISAVNKTTGGKVRTGNKLH